MTLEYDTPGFDWNNIPSDYNFHLDKNHLGREMSLPAKKGDDGYWYKGTARITIADYQEGDDLVYEYYNITVNYEFDWDGKYSAYYGYYRSSDKYKNLKSKENRETHTYERIKGSDKRHPPISPDYRSIHGTAMQGRGVAGNNITNNSLRGNESFNRAYLEDAASSILTIASGIFQNIVDTSERTSSTYLSSANELEKQAEVTIRQASEVAAKKLQENEKLFEEMNRTIRRSYYPEGSQMDEVLRYNEELKIAKAKEIEKAGSSAVDDLLKDSVKLRKEVKVLDRRATFFRAAGKVLERAGYAMIFGELFIAYYESIDGNHEKFKEAVYSFVISFATAAATGAMIGAETGIYAGPKGVVIGVIIGVIVAVIDAAVVGLTGESLGHWTNVLIKKICEVAEAGAEKFAEAIAPIAEPAMNHVLNEMTSGLVGTRGLNF